MSISHNVNYQIFKTLKKVYLLSLTSSFMKNQFVVSLVLMVIIAVSCTRESTSLDGIFYEVKGPVKTITEIEKMSIYPDQTSKNVYYVLRDEIIATSDNVKKLRECRVSNVDTDYSDIAKSINAGTAAFYNPFANELENKLYAAERQLTIQREHFGTAPAAKPAVKAAPKTKAKKK